MSRNIDFLLRGGFGNVIFVLDRAALAARYKIQPMAYGAGKWENEFEERVYTEHIPASMIQGVVINAPLLRFELAEWHKHVSYPVVYKTRAGDWTDVVKEHTSRRKNPQDIGKRSERVVQHLVSRCGMSQKDAQEAVGSHKGETSDRPALTPGGVDLFERTVKRVIRMPQYRAIMLLLPRTGARPGELATLTWDKVLRDRKTFLVIGKNSDIREIPVTKDAWRILDDYAKAFPRSKQSEWVFPRNKGPDHVSVSRAGAAMRAIRHEEKKFGDALTLHVLRHTFATEKLRECVSPAELGTIMGHRGKRVQLVYWHV
jgi:integrase